MGARLHQIKPVHVQRGRDALIAIGHSIKKPRLRHPEAATVKERASSKNCSAPQLPRCFADLPQACLSSGLRRSHSGDFFFGVELEFNGELDCALTDCRHPLCAGLSVAQKTYPRGERLSGLALLFETYSAVE